MKKVCYAAEVVWYNSLFYAKAWKLYIEDTLWELRKKKRNKQTQP